MKILVTGGCGFIGTHLCTELLALGHQVLNLDKLTYAANQEEAAVLAETNPRYALVIGDCREQELVAELLRCHRIDAVMHLAAESHVDRSISGPQGFLDANVQGTYGVLEAVRAYLPEAPPWFRLLHVSTDEVFGDLPADSTGFFDELSPYRPSSPYSASKAAADHLVRAWGRTYGVPYVITHGANAYGPGQLPDKLVPMCITNGLSGSRITIHGDGSNVRNWLHVTDHVTGLLAALTRGTLGETYCLSSEVYRSNLQLAQTICRLVSDAVGYDVTDLITRVPDRPGNDRSYRLSSSKALVQLQWAPRIGEAEFDAALRSAVRWYQSIKEV